MRVEMRTRSCALRATAMLGGLLAAAQMSQVGLTFVAPAPEAASAEAVATSSRRAMLAAAATAGLVPAWESALAEEEPKKKKERPPEALIASGFTGNPTTLNGRWSIVFGKKLNQKVVYKKDGEQLFLMSNDCGEFQMDPVVKGSCDGLAVKKDSTWFVNGKAAPELKVRPESKKDKQEVKTEDVTSAMRAEMRKMEREVETATFRGVLEDDEEVVGDRLMKKFGAKIMEGM
eukprot:gb/GFBE01028965.1/.p1 GENE.gb/GFBE01028965.1/~~gb/GFBE01028965.1/.p1  ORF type:complete len:232 (+),score=84.03 gb/GFBE01028965.1/:1-696(+)